MRLAFPRTFYAAAALFAYLWLVVITRSGQPADDWLHAALASPDWLVTPLRMVTSFGSWPFLCGLGVFSVAVLLARRRTNIALFLFAILAGGRLLAIILKLLVARPRPPIGEQLVTVHSLSFPSEHAFNSAVTYGLLALLSGSRTARYAAAVFVLLIGVSRIMLGVHWPTDVVAGWSLGIAWLSFCWGLRTARLRHKAARI